MRGERLLKIHEVAEIFGVSKTTIRRWTDPQSTIYKENFPTKIKLSSRVVGFWEREIKEYLRERRVYK